MSLIVGALELGDALRRVITAPSSPAADRVLERQFWRAPAWRGGAAVAVLRRRRPAGRHGVHLDVSVEEVRRR